MPQMKQVQLIYTILQPCKRIGCKCDSVLVAELRLDPKYFKIGQQVKVTVEADDDGR